MKINIPVEIDDAILPDLVPRMSIHYGHTEGDPTTTIINGVINDFLNKYHSLKRIEAENQAQEAYALIIKQADEALSDDDIKLAV